MNPTTNQPTCKKIQNYIFKFSDLLGQGNFSKVYKAHNEVTNQTVAIKIIQLNSLKSKKLEQLLFSEIQVLKKLNHPNILRCYEVFTSNRNCYIITELCNQGDLESKLRNQRCFSEQKAMPIIKDIYMGLEYLADKNVIHRDLKIANIFMHNSKAKIADFGFAKFTKTKFKDINIGSPIYMSPEGLIQNIYGPKTDVWAFGIMIYELLHGQTPFSHCKTQSQLKYSMSIPIGWSQLKPQLSSQIKQLIIKCLQIKQQRRATIAQLKLLAYFQKNLVNDDETDVNSNNGWNGLGKSVKQLFRGKSQQNGQQKTEQNKSVWKQEGSKQSSFIKSAGKALLRPQSFIKDDRKPSKQKQSAKSPYGKAEYQNGKVLESQSKLQDKNLSKILSADVTFKTCVNILHYCRLIYKYIAVVTGLKNSPLNNDAQKNVFIRWLACVVKVVNGRIDNRQVVYQGENAILRQEKLRQVSRQYEKKYSKQLGINMSKINPQQSSIINYQYICNYFGSILQQIDLLLQSSHDKSLLILGHYIVMITQATRMLKKCYDDHNYKIFQGYKDVEVLLNMKKQDVDRTSYNWYRKKYQDKIKK